ncbi:MAG: glycerate kinase [Roseiflexaceae bacterium]
MNPALFDTETLAMLPEGAALRRMLAAAVAAVEPGAAVRRFVQREGTTLMIDQQSYDLRQGRVVALAFGKAAAPMLAAAADVLGAYLSHGLAIVKDGHTHPLDLHPDPRIVLREASHPIPDQRGIAAAEEAMAMLGSLGEQDLALILISGGGSALLTRPADRIGLADLQHLTKLLLGCGATINQINTLRKHLDLVKGGGLVRATQARIAALILSDVVGDPLDVIASGPTVADPSSYGDAWAILEHFGILEETPAPILDRLRRGRAGQQEETLKPDDPRLARTQHVLVGSNRLAARAALDQAAQEGFTPLLLTTHLEGEAREVGHVLAAIARDARSQGTPLAAPCCIVAGGETTVTLRGNGRGGRNQELALSAALALDGLEGVVLAALATDGGDGPTDAAGAVVTGQSAARARQRGLDPLAYLVRNDSYALFHALGDLLRPGPTHTNVNDLVVMVITAQETS